MRVAAGGRQYLQGPEKHFRSAMLFFEEKSGPSNLWWEELPNIQRLARLSRVGKRNPSFNGGQNGSVKWRMTRRAAKRDVLNRNLLHVGSSQRQKCAEEVGGLPILQPLRALARHAIVHGKVFCRYSGKYKCGCGRCWHGMALKIRLSSDRG